METMIRQLLTRWHARQQHYRSQARRHPDALERWRSAELVACQVLNDLRMILKQGGGGDNGGIPDPSPPTGPRELADAADEAVAGIRQGDTIPEPIRERSHGPRLIREIITETMQDLKARGKFPEGAGRRLEATAGRQGVAA